MWYTWLVDGETSLLLSFAYSVFWKIEIDLSINL